MDQLIIDELLEAWKNAYMFLAKKVEAELNSPNRHPYLGGFNSIDEQQEQDRRHQAHMALQNATRNAAVEELTARARLMVYTQGDHRLENGLTGFRLGVSIQVNRKDRLSNFRSNIRPELLNEPGDNVPREFKEFIHGPTVAPKDFLRVSEKNIEPGRKGLRPEGD